MSELASDTLGETLPCLVAVLQYDMRLERSIYEVLQILGILLTDKSHPRDLFDKKNINDVKDLYGSS